jgi:serine/threonine protein kinase
VELAMSGIPTGDWSWVHAAAERFEQAWKKGPRPRIEDFLAEVEESRRPPLLEELIRVESELRRRAGESSSADEYQRRFPKCVSAVEAVFGIGPSRSAASDRTPRLQSTVSAASSGSVLASPLPAELANHPDYEIIRELGRGGMGVVYLAHNRIMERDEVLKVMGHDIVDHPGVLDRFLREIRAVAKLRHPNIVSAYSAFRCGGSLVFAMEYVVGLDLRRMVKAYGPMPVAHACFFVNKAALGLQHAHEEGMVHRDIKPGNLMLSHKGNRAVIKLLDFGLSKATSEQDATELGIAEPTLQMDFGEHLTRTGEMLGTPDFIAPEQIANSQKADIRADIYSLGCTLYFLLSGRPPFPSTTPYDALKAHQSTDATLLDKVRPEVPPELAALVAKMMAKDPARRFQEPAEVAEALIPFFKKRGASFKTTNFGAVPGTADAGLAPGEPTQQATDALGFLRAVTAATETATRLPRTAWSNLIKLQDNDDEDEVAPPAQSPSDGLRRFWPVLAGAVVLAAILVGFVVVSFTSRRVGFGDAGARRANSDSTRKGSVAERPGGEQVPIAKSGSGTTTGKEENLDTLRGAAATRKDARNIVPAPREATAHESSADVAATKKDTGPVAAAPNGPMAATPKATAPGRHEAASVKAATKSHPESLGGQVEIAITQGVGYLKEFQRQDGSWADYDPAPETRTGMTSLVALALFAAGEKADSPTIRKALAYLRRFGPGDLHNTYAISFQTMVFAAAEPERDQSRIRANVEWLEDAQIKPEDPTLWPGSWNYSDNKKQRGDNSNMRHALLGLHAASEVGAPVKPDVWLLSHQYWARSQRKDGSWAYTPEANNPTASMTCAGISSLIITGLHRQPGQEILRGAGITNCGKGVANRNIRGGIDWVADRFQVKQNSGADQTWRFYYLCGLERAGRLAGTGFLGSHDWFRLGALDLVAAQDKRAGFWQGQLTENNRVLATSFALLFLAKGRAPVLINKLRHAPIDDWQNDPDDVRNLVSIVSRDWKDLLTWQVVDPGIASVADLLQAPIIFFNGHRVPTFNAIAKQNLRKYVEQGGYLFADACCSKIEFDHGFKDLMKELFPDEQLKLGPLAKDHPVWRAKHLISPDILPLWGIQRGARTVVIYSPRDLSCYWNEAEQSPGNPAVIKAIKIGQNVIEYFTDRKLPPDKLSVP